MDGDRYVFDKTEIKAGTKVIVVYLVLSYIESCMSSDSGLGFEPAELST